MAKASFWTQADALLRKNLIYQKRNKRSVVPLIVFPAFLIVLLVVLQIVVNSVLDSDSFRCGCNSENQCGIQYSDSLQAAFCAVPHPIGWYPLLQVPSPEYRAVRTNLIGFSDLPDKSCRKDRSCSVITFLMESNQSLAQSLGAYMLMTSPLNQSNFLGSMTNNVFGSASTPGSSNNLDSAYLPGNRLYMFQHRCGQSSKLSIQINVFKSPFQIECAQGLNLWRNSNSEINDELYKGYRRGNSEKTTNEIVAAYDFLNSNEAKFNVNIWYNATYKNDAGFRSSIGLTRVLKSVNMVSNAYLQFLRGPLTRMQLDYTKEMPKAETKLRIDIASLLSAQFFTYVVIALFPILTM